MQSDCRHMAAVALFVKESRGRALGSPSEKTDGIFYFSGERSKRFGKVSSGVT